MSKRIALVGMPNTGKSTLFNRLTGAGAKVGNWPGLTVELLSAKLLLGDGMVELVDLPGLHNLHGFSEDERVARRFVETQPLNGILVVLNTTQLERQLALVLQMKSLGLPMFLALNMADEAKHRGIRVRTEHLEAQLGMPVRLISAKHGQGVPELKQALTAWLREHPQTTHASAIALTEDDVIEDTLNDILSDSLHIPICLSPTRTDRVDRWLLHPWLGIPLFLLIMLAVFQVVYGVGAPLQEGLGWLLDEIKTLWLAPLVAGLPTWAASFLLEGLYDGVGTVMSFLPIIVAFFLAMAVVEDSGYLARAAFLMDAIMARLGLDGRAFVMQLMGFGCNVPAMMGTRVIRSRAQRIAAMMMIPFSLCSARLQVFLFFTTAVFSPRAAPWVLFSLYVMSFLLAFLTAWLMRGRSRRALDPLLMELPPYRIPTLAALARQAFRESGHFLSQAGGFIILGVALVWFLTHVPPGRSPRQPRHPGRPDRRMDRARLHPPGHRPVAVHRPAVRLRRQGSGDRRPGRHLRRRRRRTLRPARPAPGLDAGLQLHAVHPDLHPLPLDPRHPAQGVRQRSGHVGIPGLVPGRRVAVELRVLSDGEGPVRLRHASTIAPEGAACRVDLGHPGEIRAQ
jgi:ferrous iron transport protein B